MSGTARKTPETPKETYKHPARTDRVLFAARRPNSAALSIRAAGPLQQQIRSRAI